MRLFWIRHGQMELRASASLDARGIDRLFNQEDEAGLSPRGKREAALVAERLRVEGVDAIYASPLLRARETAEVSAAALGMRVEITPAISELRTGYLAEESRAAAWVRRVMGAPIRPSVKRVVLGGSLIPIYYHSWRTGRTVGGESPAELDARVDGFFAELERRHERGARVALFAHGYLILTLALRLASSPLARLAVWRRLYIPNGAITVVTLDRGALALVRYADARHLKKLASSSDRRA